MEIQTKKNAAEGETVYLLSKEVKLLRERLIDLESRSNNIRLTGLKEGAEADDLTSFLKKIFQVILDLKDGDPLLKIDQAHRALYPSQIQESPPDPS